MLTVYIPAVFVLHAEDMARLYDARSFAMGNCVTTQTYSYNPALLSFSQGHELTFVYYNRNGMKDMSACQVGFLCPSGFLDFGFSVSSFGNSNYRDNMLSCGGSKIINTCWTMGMFLSCHVLQLKETDESIVSPSLDLGTVYLLSEEIKLGFSCVNIPLTNDFMRKSRYSLHTGLEWKPNDSLLFAAEVQNNAEIPVAGHLGVEYGFMETLYIRAGIRTNPLIPSVGLGYRYSLCGLDAGVAYHYVLGISPNLTLKFFI